MRRETKAQREERERIEAERLAAHAADTRANPLTEDEVGLWLASLTKLDETAGKVEQLAVCEELLRNAPEDDMLDADARIIKLAIEQLTEELQRETIPHRRVYHRGPDGVCDNGEDDSTDDTESPADPFLGFDESE